MGLDDRNEGGPGECPEHDWELEHVALAASGGTVYMKCKLCEAISTA